MKNTIIIAIITTTILSCTKNKTTALDVPNVTIQNKKSPLIGVWEMTDRYLFENGVITDSMKTKEGNKNIKMFTPKYYMWSGQALPEQKEYFGHGTYTWTDSSYTTTTDYYSKAMEGHSKITTMKLIFGDKTYLQIHSDSTGPYYAERYIKIE